MKDLQKRRILEDIIDGLRLYRWNIKTIVLFCILITVASDFLGILLSYAERVMGGGYDFSNFFGGDSSTLDIYDMMSGGVTRTELVFPWNALYLLLMAINQIIIAIISLYGTALVAAGSLSILRKQDASFPALRAMLRPQAKRIIKFWLLLQLILQSPLYIAEIIYIMTEVEYNIILIMAGLLLYLVALLFIWFLYCIQPYILGHQIDGEERPVLESLSMLRRSFKRYLLLGLFYVGLILAIMLILALIGRAVELPRFVTHPIYIAAWFLSVTVITALYQHMLSKSQEEAEVQEKEERLPDEPITVEEITDIFQIHITPSLSFEEVGDFSCGLARVKQSGFAGRWGYIDTAGHMVLPHAYRSADDFVDVLAVVKNRRGEHFINKSGQAITPDYDYAEGFSEGLAPVKIKTNWGFANLEGKVHALPYDEVFGFREGLSAVRHDGRWLYIDKDLAVKIETDYNEVWSFYDGLAMVMRDKKYGFIDSNGVERVPPRYDEADSFHEGLAAIAVRQPDGELRWGYIDERGQEIIPPRFDSALSFQEGRAAVCLNRRYGHIDTAGQFITPPEYRTVSSFRQGYAVVKAEGYGYVDRQGTECAEPVYLDARPFREGLAWVRTAKGWGVLRLPEEM